MMCQNCKAREAKVHLTHIVNNKKIEMHFCDQCAKEKGQLGLKLSVNINDFLSSIVGASENMTYVNSKPQKVICENCGMDFQEFKHTGKMGCSKCYEVFDENLNKLLKRIHGNVRHHGKIPEKVSNCIKTSMEVESLKEELSKCIKNEEYEKAAELRDKIKIIESESRC